MWRMTGGIRFRRRLFIKQVLGNQYRQFPMVEVEGAVVPWEDVSGNAEWRIGVLLLVGYSLPSFFGIQFQRPQ
jgi:hypothetical protein